MPYIRHPPYKLISNRSLHHKYGEVYQVVSVLFAIRDVAISVLASSCLLGQWDIAFRRLYPLPVLKWEPPIVSTSVVGGGRDSGRKEPSVVSLSSPYCRLFGPLFHFRLHYLTQIIVPEDKNREVKRFLCEGGNHVLFFFVYVCAKILA
ncbi:hypothetical protein TNCT_641541 [Trichonephila clavata]|uniref:Uncharacterized protein n=1 Tax=Trichonephila clavata TaxID=2740835 RepID=A0A8X6M0I9_TRICU|nr:hypothetical protein TNCT_641541 [Trichonephila clavata]